EGQIDDRGAAIVVWVGVSVARQKLLEKMGFVVPSPIAVRAQIDTGSHLTGFLPEVFRRLDLTPFGDIAIRTPSTKPGEPCQCNQFDVSVTLVSGTVQECIASVHAIAGEDFDRHEDGIQAILGRDILDRCTFHYYGPQRAFALSF